MLQKSRKPMMTHERAVHVFGALADFAERYPDLCEHDHRLYRDLCRAAMMSLDDEQHAESMLLRRGVDEWLMKQCKQDVGSYIVGQLRQRGFSVRILLEPPRLSVEPRQKLTPAIRARISNWKDAIRTAILAEVPTT